MLEIGEILNFRKDVQLVLYGSMRTRGGESWEHTFGFNFPSTSLPRARARAIRAGTKAAVIPNLFCAEWPWHDLQRIRSEGVSCDLLCGTTCISADVL